MKRVTLANPFDGEPAAFQGAIFLYRLQSIFTAGGVKTTAGSLKG